MLMHSVFILSNLVFASMDISGNTQHMIFSPQMKQNAGYYLSFPIKNNAVTGPWIYSASSERCEAQPKKEHLIDVIFICIKIKLKYLFSRHSVAGYSNFEYLWIEPAPTAELFSSQAIQWHECLHEYGQTNYQFWWCRMHTHIMVNFRHSHSHTISLDVSHFDYCMANVQLDAYIWQLSNLDSLKSVGSKKTFDE